MSEISLKFEDFLSFLFILKLSCSKSFHNNLNYASAASIGEVMKFYNVGDKTFETDFNRRIYASFHYTSKLSKVCFKSFVTWIIKLYNLSNI